jgi:O-antigen ligase
VVATHYSTFVPNLRTASSGRSSLVSGGLHLFGQRPLAGWGSGSFTHEYTREYPGIARSVSDSHNIPVTILAEQGLIGIISYAALVISALIMLFRGLKGNGYRIAIAAAFLALLLHTQLYADFLEDPTTWVLLALGSALTVTGTYLGGGDAAPRAGALQGPEPAPPAVSA